MKRNSEEPQRNKLLYAGFAAAVAALLLFGWLANDVMRGTTLQFDGFVRDGVHAWASPALTLAMRVITEFGSFTFLIAASVVLVWGLARMGRRHAAILLAVAGGGAFVLDNLLKLAFHRPRPEAFFGLTAPETFSFPSGHAISSCCFYGVAAAILSSRIRSHAAKAAIWVAAALAAALIGLSRIYLGFHYPSDVVAGYAAGIVWVAAIRVSYDAWLRRRLS